MTHRDPTPTRDRRRSLGPWQRFALGMAGYSLLVVLQGFWLEPGRFPLALMVPLALLPVVPALWAMLGWLDAVRAQDELQRRIQAEAGLFALGTTALLAVSYGFLEVYLQWPRPSGFAVWVVIWAAYALGGARARRRYR